jgi:hypothetical protein
LRCEIVILTPVSQTKGDCNTGTVVVAETVGTGSGGYLH